MSDWLPIARFFETEPDWPIVLLCAGRQEVSGYWDDDAGLWFREGEGTDLESESIEPTHFRSLSSAS
jgi:hypothetical protein